MTPFITFLAGFLIGGYGAVLLLAKLHRHFHPLGICYEYTRERLKRNRWFEAQRQAERERYHEHGS